MYRYTPGSWGEIDIQRRRKDRPGSGTLPSKASLEILVRGGRGGGAI